MVGRFLAIVYNENTLPGAPQDRTKSITVIVLAVRCKTSFPGIPGKLLHDNSRSLTNRNVKCKFRNGLDGREMFRTRFSGPAHWRNIMQIRRFQTFDSYIRHVSQLGFSANMSKAIVRSQQCFSVFMIQH